MDAHTQDIIVGITIGVGTTGVLSIVALILRLANLPKRITRLENATPILLGAMLDVLDAVVGIMKAVEDHKLNGEVKTAREKIETARGSINGFLTNASISQKVTK